MILASKITLRCFWQPVIISVLCKWVIFSIQTLWCVLNGACFHCASPTFGTLGSHFWASSWILRAELCYAARMFSVIYGLWWVRVLVMETVQSCMAHGKAIPGRHLHCGAPGYQKAMMVNLAHVKKVLHMYLSVSGFPCHSWDFPTSASHRQPESFSFLCCVQASMLLRRTNLRPLLTLLTPLERNSQTNALLFNNAC